MVHAESTGADEAERSPTHYDSREDTLEHMRQVQKRLGVVEVELRERGSRHDMSKLGPEEKPIFDAYTPKLKELSYGSDEYNAALSALGPALQHHYQENTHHPEHYFNGIAGMDLLDLIEMYCDWAAACLRHKDGDMAKSIQINRERYGISGDLGMILMNTWERHGGFRGYEGHRLMDATETKAHGPWTYDFDWTSGGLELMRRPMPNFPFPPERPIGDRSVDSESDAGSLNQITSSESNSDA